MMPDASPQRAGTEPDGGDFASMADEPAFDVCSIDLAVEL